MKKRIALVVDADDWAYANIAENISQNLKEYYDFIIIPSQYFNDNIVPVLLLTEDCDLIHFFWRGRLLDLSLNQFDKSVGELMLTKEDFLKKFFDKKIITTAVYDHLYIDSEDKVAMTNNMLEKCDYYYTSSKKLFDIYSKLNLVKKPTCEITDGVNLSEFYPKNLERFNNIKSRKIVVGWVGNSKWQGSGEDYKGVNTILKPAITELISEGYPIEMYFADRQERMIPHNEMVDYYSSIDLYICTSAIEGTPNPVLESMACGVPIISTDVGIVREVFGDIQKKYILKERSKDNLKQTILNFINNLDEIEAIQQEQAISIQNWQWKNISERMRDFFEFAFNQKQKI